MTEELRTAASKAEMWLRSTEPVADEERAYRDLGLVLCGCAKAKRSPPDNKIEHQMTVLPDPTSLIEMDRSALLELSRHYVGEPCSKNDSDLAIAHLATAFARSDDVQGTAALLRLSELLHTERDVTYDAWSYVLAQQQNDGSFGLLAPELALLGKPEEKARIQIGLTVEVLWSIVAAIGREG
jgi:hypothetical protein